MPAMSIASKMSKMPLPSMSLSSWTCTLPLQMIPLFRLNCVLKAHCKLISSSRRTHYVRIDYVPNDAASGLKCLRQTLDRRDNASRIVTFFRHLNHDFHSRAPLCRLWLLHRTCHHCLARIWLVPPGYRVRYSRGLHDLGIL